MLWLSTEVGLLQLVASLEMLRLSEWVGGHLLFPGVSVLLPFQGRGRMSVPHGSSFPKAGLLLPPLGAGNKGRAQHGRHCHRALEKANLWEAWGGHLLILVLPFTYKLCCGEGQRPDTGVNFDLV